MSLLEQICKRKGRLKTTETIVTQADGRRYLESGGCPEKEISGKCFGFVVDTKPDNVPAEIIEHVYLGSQDCCELSVLQNYNISHVLSIGIEASCLYSHIKYKFVKCLDLPETNIVKIIKEDCIEFINETVKNRQNILIHCNAGVSRSSAVVIGFLMLVHNLTYNESYNIVKSKRPCIKLNTGFEKQLKEL